MPPYAPEPESPGRKRDFVVSGLTLLVALAAMYLSPPGQQRVASVLQATALRPFLEIQKGLERARVRSADVEVLTEQIDSLTRHLATHAALQDENRTLRSLLGLAERAGDEYRPATLVRPGTPGSGSMFFVDVGSQDGIRAGSAVVGPKGLVGVIREVRARDAVGMDWTHPEFGLGAMLEDGSAFGLVKNVPGDFREDDRLLLNGVPANLDVPAGTSVVTSGSGGVLPRGIPIGTVAGLETEEGGWRRAYWVDAHVAPGEATHVLVITRTVSEVGEAWSLEPPGIPSQLPDSAQSAGPNS